MVAADVRDLGIPPGWGGNDYDRWGYDALNKGDLENARRLFDAAIRSDPYLWTAYYNRAVTCIQQKKWTAALQDLNLTLRLKPSVTNASLLRALVNTRLGNYKDSLKDLNAVEKIARKVYNSIESAEVLNNRAWLQATCPDASVRNGQLAIHDATKACEMCRWYRPSYIDTLAAAYAETGDFDSAVRYEEQAISQASRLQQEIPGIVAKSNASKQEKEKLAATLDEEGKKSLSRLSKRLTLYKQRQAYRDIAPQD